MDSWLQLTEAEFSTWHTFKPRGLVPDKILLDKIYPGESCQSKEQRYVCSQQELRDAVLQALTTPVSVLACSPQKMRPTEGVGWHWGAPRPSQSTAPNLLISPGDSTQQLLPSPSSEVLWSFSIPPALPWISDHQNANCLYCSSESIPMTFMIMSKYIVLILWLGKWRWREAAVV